MNIQHPLAYARGNPAQYTGLRKKGSCGEEFGTKFVGMIAES